MNVERLWTSQHASQEQWHEDSALDEPYVRHTTGTPCEATFQRRQVPQWHYCAIVPLCCAPRGSRFHGHGSYQPHKLVSPRISRMRHPWEGTNPQYRYRKSRSGMRI